MWAHLVVCAVECQHASLREEKRSLVHNVPPARLEPVLVITVHPHLHFFQKVEAESVFDFSVPHRQREYRGESAQSREGKDRR